jgi:hypothetical protein
MGLLDGHHIGGLFDDANNSGIALRRCAVSTRIDIGDVVTYPAGRDFLFDVGDGLSESFRLPTATPKDIESNTLGRLQSDTG